MVNIMPGVEQQQLIEFVVNFLADQLPVERLRSGGREVSKEIDLWSEICELGWFAMSLEEEQGGYGFTFADEVLMYKEFGRHLLSPTILATRLALHAAAFNMDAELVDKLNTGKCRAAIGLIRPETSLDSDSASGTFYLIDSENADVITLWNEKGFGIFKREDFQSLREVKSLDWSSTITLCQAENLVPEIWVDAMSRPLPTQAMILVSAILAGNAEGTRDMAVEYAKLREQFGKPIGSFQAIKHHCANMAVRCETAWAQTLYAALALSEDLPSAQYDAHAARILATDAAIKNGEVNIQVHGGIGFTAEADPQLFLKRAHLYNQIGGNIRYHQNQLISLENADI